MAALTTAWVVRPRAWVPDGAAASSSAPSPCSSSRPACATAPARSPPAVSRTAGRRGSRSRTVVRALDLDQDTLLALGVGLAGLAVGIGVPVFYETQVKNAETRENDQPCFPCKGTGAQTCRFCTGAGNVTVELGGGEREVSKCINCEGAGSIVCTTCQGNGVQPRYLDRREFKDDD